LKSIKKTEKQYKNLLNKSNFVIKMVEFKLVIGLKKGQSVQKEIKSPEADIFLNKKLGEKISGDKIGFSGYEFMITGGSDKCGFPMRSDVAGGMRKKIFTTKSTGVSTRILKKERRKKKPGMKRKGKKIRKSVFGNTIVDDIIQINQKV